MEGPNAKSSRFSETRARREKQPAQEVAALWKRLRERAGDDPVAHNYLDEKQRELSKQFLTLYPGAERASESYHHLIGSTPPPELSGKDIPGLREQIVLELERLERDGR